MPGLLVSVCSAEEAEIAAAAGVDLVDAKDPARGALGALEPAVVRDIVARVGTRTATSAVAGEPEDGALAAGIAAMAATGAHYIKVALHAGMSEATLAEAAAMSPSRLIGVLFAEDGFALDVLRRLAVAGFAGAMIDTRGKNGRSLTGIVAEERLRSFVEACRAHGLRSGLAGSLRIADIAPLCGLGADYLGFRGSLCSGRDRRNSLDPQRVRLAVETMRGLGCSDAA